ncbi:hypothetical protein KW794_00495 [Candidatus Saccharibacteria bacterium]|nr:hypothetical protein [Candidatus Saccharibacteria bacterium]
MPKEVKKKRPKPAAAKTRARKLTKKQARAKSKIESRKLKPIIGSFRLTRRVLQIFIQFWKPLGGIVLVYLILNIVFASGISNISTNFSSIKDDLNAGGGHGLWRAAGGFGSLVGSAGASSSGTGSALQSMLFIIESLVIIWALRHLLSGQNITVKGAYYRSMTPLIPFLLVVFMIIIQLLPLTLGGVILAAVATSIFTSTTAATIFTTLLFLVLAAWSIYMVSASIFALYIVTLPDMKPLQALRAAKDLVRFRRFAVLRKVFFMPIFILVVMGIIIVPLILYAQGVVPIAFYILSMLSILFVHTYIYSLYRELIDE